MEEKDGKDQHERGKQLAITERKASDLGPGRVNSGEATTLTLLLRNPAIPRFHSAAISIHCFPFLLSGNRAAKLLTSMTFR